MGENEKREKGELTLLPFSFAFLAPPLSRLPIFPLQPFLIDASCLLISYRISRLFPCIFYVPDKSFTVNNVAELHSCLQRRLGADYMEHFQTRGWTQPCLPGWNFSPVCNTKLYLKIKRAITWQNFQPRAEFNAGVEISTLFSYNLGKTICRLFEKYTQIWKHMMKQCWFT